MEETTLEVRLVLWTGTGGFAGREQVKREPRRDPTDEAGDQGAESKL
jgi:hypothetical protein